MIGEKIHNHAEIARDVSELVFSSLNNDEPNFSGQLPWLAEFFNGKRDFVVIGHSALRKGWEVGKSERMGRSPREADWDYCRTCRPVWTWRNCPWKTLTFHFQSWQRAAGTSHLYSAGHAALLRWSFLLLQRCGLLNGAILVCAEFRIFRQIDFARYASSAASDNKKAIPMYEPCTRNSGELIEFIPMHYMRRRGGGTEKCVHLCFVL